MTQRLLRPLILTCLMAIALPLHAHAGPESQTMPAVSREDMAKASAKANQAKAPGDAAAVGQKTGEATAAPAPKELTGADKDAAIAKALSIGAFDPAQVVGMAKPWQIYYQKAESPVMEKLEGLHDMVMVIITIITIFVLALLVFICIRFRAKANPTARRFAHNTVVEVVWTVIPILILILIGIPSIRVHYEYAKNANIIDNPDLTLKVTGNQWYWHYDYSDFGFGYDSNITKTDKLKPGEPRLLMVDNPIVVPVNKVVRVQITSADVIHSWAMPAFGVKQDAVPGKLSETWFKAEEPGIYFGQCSELCGKYHGFMPIMIKVVSDEDFKAWTEGAKLKFAANDNMQFALNQ